MYFNLRLFAMTRGLRLRIFFAAAVGLLAVGAGIARLALSGIVIASVFEGEAFSALTVPLLAVGALIVLRAVLQYARDVVSNHTATRTKIQLRKQLYQHALALGPGHFDQRRTGNVLMFLVDGVENLETFFGQYLPQFMVAAVAPVLIFGFMAFLDVQVGLIFLVFAVFTLFAPSLIQKLNRKRNVARRDAYGALGADFLDSVQGLGTLKAFGQSKVRGELLARRARDLFRTTMKVLAADGVSGAATTLGVSAGAVAALVWGGVRVNDGDLDLRSLVIILMLGGEVFRPLRELVGLYHQGMAAMSSAEGIFEVLDSPVTVQNAKPAGGSVERAAASEASPDGPAPEIAFESVSFGYEGGRRPALEDVSFTLNAGETLGLVGPSGAGKSTIVWLLLRFYDPQQGRITLGGQDLREIPLETLRDQIAVVTQDTYLFQGTVAENLRLGRADASLAELEEAARAANAHDFISGLPQGYETYVGERGVRLSGGERQRIAIARALLKAAPILVLDEALSSVDAQNEAAIQEALDRLMRGRTTLVIAHRLSSVVDAHRILVLDGGRLVETGSHHELAAAGATYSRLMANQQARTEQDILAATLPSIAGDGAPAEAVRRPEASAGLGAPQGESETGVAKPMGSTAVWLRLFGQVSRWKGKLGLSLGLGLTNHGASIALGALSALLVAQVFKGGDKGGDIGVFLVLLAIFVPLVAVARWGESWVSHDLAFRLLAEMRVDLYAKLEPLAPAYLVRRKSGDLTSVVGGDVETIEFFYAHVVAPAFVAILVPGAVLAALALVSWPLALVLLPFLVVGALSPLQAQKSTERLGEEMRRHLGELNAYMVDGIQGMREIVAFGAGRARVEETVHKGLAFSRHRVRFLGAKAFHAAVMETVTAFAGLAVLVTGTWLVAGGNMEPASLPLAALLALTSFSPVAELAVTLKQLMETLAASRRIFEVHDEPVTVHDGPGVLRASDDRFLKDPSIEFDHVGFAYDGNPVPALDDVTFAVGAGQTVALVGRSGAGKSTSAQLLLRFWDPQRGGVALGGHDLREFNLDELRRHVALVSQDTYLFNTTIRENLRMAKQDASQAEIERAARLANASEFIDDLPDGYDTPVGERGMQLSGGQRQRISIARALLKDAPILVLDEATSHLDAVNEQQVREALGRLMAGRTTMVIAHRLSTVRDADRIIVLDSGSLVEEGAHQELLAQGGLYARLVQTQLVGASGRAKSDAAG